MRRIDYKVPKGKLLRIDAELCKGRVTKLKLHGDFFIHPEKGISKIEDAIRGQKVDEALRQKLMIVTKDFKMIGLSVEDIMHVLGKFISD